MGTLLTDGQYKTCLRHRLGALFWVKHASATVVTEFRARKHGVQEFAPALKAREDITLLPDSSTP
eukprot:8813976-Lingulodinium_polyedra.AAC.1